MDDIPAKNSKKGRKNTVIPAMPIIQPAFSVQPLFTELLLIFAAGLEGFRSIKAFIVKEQYYLSLFEYCFYLLMNSVAFDEPTRAQEIDLKGISKLF